MKHKNISDPNFEYKILKRGLLGPKKLQLTEKYIIHLPWIQLENVFVPGAPIKIQGNCLILSEKFIWNGASFFTYDTSSSFRATAVHDALYTVLNTCNVSFSRRQSDKFFYKILLEDRMWKWRARGWYHAVRNGGFLYI